MKKAMFRLLVATVVVIVSVPALAQVGVGFNHGGGGDNFVTNSGQTKSSWTVGIYDVGIGVRTDIQTGVLQLRLRLAETPGGCAEATIAKSEELGLWRPDDGPLGARKWKYLVGSMDLTGIDPRRLVGLKARLIGPGACCQELPINCVGCSGEFSIPLEKLADGNYTLDLQAFDNAKKNSLKIPLASIGWSRENQQTNGIYTFTVFDPSPILANYWVGRPPLPLEDDQSLYERINLQRLVIESQAIQPAKRDLSLEELGQKYDDLIAQERMKDGPLFYEIKLTLSDGKTPFLGSVVMVITADGQKYRRHCSGKSIVLGEGTTEGWMDFTFEFPNGQVVEKPHQFVALGGGFEIKAPNDGR